jgi:hypothetical protein
MSGFISHILIEEKQHTPFLILKRISPNERKTNQQLLIRQLRVLRLIRACLLRDSQITIIAVLMSRWWRWWRGSMCVYVALGTRDGVVGFIGVCSRAPGWSIKSSQRYAFAELEFAVGE